MGNRKRNIIKSFVLQEDGTSAIDFIATIPWVIIVALMCAQLLVAMQTIIIVQSAAREGARAASVGENVYAAVQSSAPMISPRTSVSIGGDRVSVTVSAAIPTFAFAFDLPEVSSTATMRNELNE